MVLNFNVLLVSRETNEDLKLYFKGNKIQEIVTGLLNHQDLEGSNMMNEN